MGLYTHLKEKLEPFVEEPSRQQKIDEAKAVILGAENSEDANSLFLAAKFEEYTKERDEIDERDKEISLLRAALTQMLTYAMEADRVQNITLENGTLIYKEYIPIPSVKDEKAALKWAWEEMPEILTVTFKGLAGSQLKSLKEWAEFKNVDFRASIHDGTLKTTAKDFALQGKPDPPGVKIYGLSTVKCKPAKVSSR